ncbi:type II secretion system protein [Candidatus Saccharibacteria bacterium]|nr:type II secretion system protein [Candidatus Saccharibacteria bacterium]
MTNKNNKKGFTIIEVVLVLAIAGLIFLMVFIALPALQRSQRNTRRRQDMARILSAFNDYQANNNGNFPDATKPAEMNKFAKKYVDPSCTLSENDTKLDGCADQFVDPDGTQYSFAAGTTGADVSGDLDHIITFYTNAKCNGEKTAAANGGNRSIAITYILEGGAVYCGDNQ